MTPSDPYDGDPTTASSPEPPHPSPATTTASGTVLGPKRLHGASPVLDIVPYFQQIVPPVIVLVVSIGRWAIPVIVVVSAVTIGWRVLAWTRHSYRIADGMLRIDSGVLRRDSREIPIARIQQVDLRRQLRHRVLGVVAVRIDTAGGGSGAEAVLDAMSDRDALELRSVLLDHRPPSAVPVGQAHGSPDPNAGPTGDPTGQSPDHPPGQHAAPIHPAEVLSQLSTRDLVIAGVTGSGLLAGLSVFAFGFVVLDYLPDDTGEQVSGGLLDLLGTAAVLAVVAVLIVPLWLAFAAGSSVLRDHDFTLVRYGGDLHLRRGLLDQREATLALHRIQAVWVLDNPLRRRLGLVSVQLQSAGSGSDASSSVARVTVPLVRSADLTALLQVVMPGVRQPELVPAPPAARRRAHIRSAAGALLAVLVVAAISRSPFAAIALVVLVPSAVYAERYYRSLGHVLTDVALVTRWGAVLRRTAMVPVAKTQSCLLRTTPFQRRVDLASLRVQVAGKGPTVSIVDGADDLLTSVRDRILVAPGARLDEVAVRRRTLAGLEAAEGGAQADVGSDRAVVQTPSTGDG